jgi:hypothetical protein
LARIPDADNHPQGRPGGHILLVPSAARATDLAIGEKTAGPEFLAADESRLDCYRSLS